MNRTHFRPNFDRIWIISKIIFIVFIRQRFQRRLHILADGTLTGKNMNFATDFLTHSYDVHSIAPISTTGSMKLKWLRHRTDQKTIDECRVFVDLEKYRKQQFPPQHEDILKIEKKKKKRKQRRIFLLRNPQKLSVIHTMTSQKHRNFVTQNEFKQMRECMEKSLFFFNFPFSPFFLSMVLIPN